jgi:hypothetical protein
LYVQAGPRVLPRRDVPFRTTAAGEHKFAGLLGGVPQVIINSLAGLFRQLESGGLSGLLLPDRGPIDRIYARRDVLDLEGDEIAAPRPSDRPDSMLPPPERPALESFIY